MEDPVRKVGASGGGGGGGSTAGGDRWEGEDEDEDVKVGAGQGSGQRGSGLTPSGAGLPAEGRAGGLGPGAPPGPAGRASRREQRARRCPLPLRSRAIWARDGQRGLSDFLGKGGSGGPCFSLKKVGAPAWIPPANWRREVTAAAGPAHVQTSQSEAARRSETGKLGIELPWLRPYGKTLQPTCVFELGSPHASNSFMSPRARLYSLNK